jgi:DNA-binding NarL/FixJ family response regulator
MSRPRRALVLDDLAASRRWLRAALEQAYPEIEVIEAASLAEAVERLGPAPDLALIDLGLPDGSGVQMIERLCADGGTLCVVATIFDDDAHLFPALRAGAQGYVLKDMAQEELSAMLLGIADGQPPLSPSIARRLLRHFGPALPPVNSDLDSAKLTEREKSVLQLIGKGLTVGEAANALELSRHTCAGYVKDIYRKLRVSSRAEAALAATRMGLVGRDAR